MFTFNSAKAETVNGWQTMLERGDVRKGIFSKEAIMERGGTLQEFGGVFDKLGVVLDWIISAGAWLNNLPSNIAQLSVDLWTKVFELLMFMLQTPLFIFNNSFLTDTSMVFAGVSVVLVTVLTMINYIKRMLKKENTDTKSIMKRWFLACVGTGFAPFAFEQSFNLLNKVSVAITKIGGSQMSSEGMMNALKLSGFNTLILMGFDLVLVVLMFQFLLQNGRRCFDLCCLAAITPLALAASVFDDTKHLHTQWWNAIKKLGMVQIIYATFICLLGVMMFATKDIVTGWGLLFKACICMGGLFRLVNPPRFVLSRLDNGGNVIDSGKSAWKDIKDIYNTVTLKKPRQILTKREEDKMSKIRKLRKEHGRRSVGDLI